MRHKKLYIPTSTLNFNNIMASESISPAEFYLRRGFGYKRWEKVEPNKLDNRIILYDKFPNFKITDNEYENYPLVIEINTEYLEEDIIQVYKDGVYFSEETIYLNPFNTQIIFDNELDKRNTLSKVKQSLNTKLLAIYDNQIVLKSETQECFEWKETILSDSNSDISRFIAKDRKINKLKGFLYAYLLGGNKSLTPEIVTLKKNAKELNNILSSVLTSENGNINNQKREQLDELYRLINDAFLFADEKFIDEVNRINKKHKIDVFQNILKTEGLLDFWVTKNNLVTTYRLVQFSYTNSISVEDNMKALDDYLDMLYKQINTISTRIKLKENELPTLLHSNLIDNIDGKPFTPKLFNLFLNDTWCKDEFITDRFIFATEGGKIFKQHMEQEKKWENSSAKEYINLLRNNLKSHTPFNVGNTKNNTLKSFACFCQKGEDDIQKLEDYLISNEISDFRIAFALWGLIFGFANMPKTLTNELFLSDDLKYISTIYKYIFKQIHAIELSGELEIKHPKVYSILPSKINKNAINNSDILATTEHRKYSKETLDFYEKIELTCKSAKSDRKTYLLYIEEYGVSETLLDILIRDKKLNKGKGILKGIRKLIERELQLMKNNNNRNIISLEEKLDKEFYIDGNIIKVLSRQLPNDNKIQNKFEKDLKWFQDEYKKGPDSQYYSKAKRDNESVIEAFRRYLEKKEYGPTLGINDIIYELHKLYK